MGKKKKGAIAAKARAKKEAKNRSSTPERANNSGGAAPRGDVVPGDGNRVQRGLQNLGNTCYMNSILQCLNVSSPFSDELMQFGGPGPASMTSSLCAAFRGIRGMEDEKSNAAYSPKPLLSQLVVRYPWFRGKEQQDAHEFLRTLLGSLSDECEQATRRPSSKADKGAEADSAEAGGKTTPDFVSRYFSGRLCAVTLCWGCGRLSLRLDPFLDLQLHLPALAGQSVGALGITPAMASGAQEPASGGEADGADGAESDMETARSRKKKGGKNSKAASSSGPAPAGPKKGKPLIGVWAASKSAGDLRDSVRALVLQLVVRVLERQIAAADAAAAAAAAASAEAGAAEAEGCPEEPSSPGPGPAEGAEAQAGGAQQSEGEADGEGDVDGEGRDSLAGQLSKRFQVELQRKCKKTHPHWGFNWSEAKCEAGSLVLAGVSEDSLLEKWNIKCRAIGEEDLLICVGDSLVEVNGETTFKGMNKALRSDDKVNLTFVRGGAAVAKGGKLGRSRAESGGEEEKRAEAAKAREELRKTFCAKAEECHQSLAPVLAEIFGAERPPPKPADRVTLERCLQQFSAVEALEDGYKPTYQCAECSKDGGGRTFASRRMWLWPANLPPLLTLQLKRFRRYRDKFEKSVASIALPTHLDLSDFVLAPAELERLRPFVCKGSDIQDTNGQTAAPGGLRYELYGLCVHEGASMKCGHYVAYVNAGPSLEEEKWYGISDSKMHHCKRSEVLEAEAYVAFYRREGLGAVRPEQAGDTDEEGGDADDAASKSSLED